MPVIQQCLSCEKETFIPDKSVTDVTYVWVCSHCGAPHKYVNSIYRETNVLLDTKKYKPHKYYHQQNSVQ